VSSYERTEFLGDAVLDVCPVFPLFNSNPDASEEEMTLLKHALVSNGTWAALAQKLELDEFVLTGSKVNFKPESKAMADLTEAFFGALFLDSSLMNCCTIYQKLVIKYSQLFYHAVGRIHRGKEIVDYIISSPAEEFCKMKPWTLPKFFHPITIT
jgi:ribonuclease-3